MVNKQELRKAIRAQKRAMTEEEIVAKSAALAEKFLAGETNLVCRKMDGDDTSPSIYS